LLGLVQANEVLLQEIKAHHQKIFNIKLSTVHFLCEEQANLIEIEDLGV
jgi:hypothetical protein